MKALPARSGLHPPAAFGAAQGLRYGALGFPLAFLAVPLYVQLPGHYAGTLGVALPSLGLVLLLTRLADALADPFIGIAADRLFARSTQAAWGTGAVAAAGMALGFGALFFPPDDGAPLAWLAAWLLLTYVAYSALTVLHQAWGVRLGGEAAVRTRIVGWREGFGLIGVIVASVLPALAGLPASTAVLALSLAAGMALLARAPRPVRCTPAAGVPWVLPWRQAAFRRLLAIFLLNGIASAIPATLVLFFIRDRLQAPQAEPLLLGGYFLSAVCSLPLWTWAARRIGLARAWAAGMALALLSFGWTFTLGPGDVVAFGGVCVASGIALGADLTSPGALLSGVVQRADPRVAAQGVYVGWWNMATKLNLGVAAGLALPLLSWAGYAPGRQDGAALAALGVGYVIVPCALKLLAAGLLWRWWLQPGEPE